MVATLWDREEAGVMSGSDDVGTNPHPEDAERPGGAGKQRAAVRRDAAGEVAVRRPWVAEPRIKLEDFFPDVEGEEWKAGRLQEDLETDTLADDCWDLPPHEWFVEIEERARQYWEMQIETDGLLRTILSVWCWQLRQKAYWQWQGLRRTYDRLRRRW
jgi:hypothetical protein